MNLVERLRKSAESYDVLCDDRMADFIREAASHIESQDKRIRELEGALRLVNDRAMILSELHMEAAQQWSVEGEVERDKESVRISQQFLDIATITPDNVNSECIRLRHRVEQLRGLCKTAVGYLRDADQGEQATQIASLIGDMEPLSVPLSEGNKP